MQVVDLSVEHEKEVVDAHDREGNELPLDETLHVDRDNEVHQEEDAVCKADDCKVLGIVAVVYRQRAVEHAAHHVAERLGNMRSYPPRQKGYTHRDFLEVVGILLLD